MLRGQCRSGAAGRDQPAVVLGMLRDGREDRSGRLMEEGKGAAAAGVTASLLRDGTERGNEAGHDQCGSVGAGDNHGLRVEHATISSTRRSTIRGAFHRSKAARRHRISCVICTAQPRRGCGLSPTTCAAPVLDASGPRT